MAKYDIEIEVKKIQKAFIKVKEDYNHVLKRLYELEKENISLRALASNNKEIKILEKYNVPEKRVYIANRESKKVHSQDCPFGKKIGTQNREVFDTVSDALKERYSRCSCVMS